MHQYFQLESEKEMIEEEYHFYMGQAQMISYGAMLGKIKKAILGKDDGDTKKLLELLLDTWIDEVEDQLKENTVYQGMLEKISKYEEQVQTMGLAKEKRKTIDAYVTEVSERWILYAESLYQAGMQKISGTTKSVKKGRIKWGSTKGTSPFVTSIHLCHQ